MSTVLFDELSEIDNSFLEDEFDELFDNQYEGKKYIVSGVIQLWDGKSEGHHPKIFDSIKDALLGCKEGFGICYLKVVEENYGKMSVEVSHHDGTNYLVVRELTSKGEEFIGKVGVDVGDLLNCRGATRNVKFLKHQSMRN